MARPEPARFTVRRYEYVAVMHLVIVYRIMFQAIKNCKY